MQLLRLGPCKVRELAFSPDGSTLAYVAGRAAPSASLATRSTRRPSRRVWLIDLASYTRSSLTHSHAVASLAFGPVRFPCLAVSDSLGNITLWDLSTRLGRELAILRPRGAAPVHLAIAPDGQSLAGIGEARYFPGSTERLSRGIALWDTATCRPRRFLPAPRAPYLSLAFASTGSLLAAGALDRTIRLWDVDRNEQVVALRNAFRPSLLSFAPDGRMLAAGNSRGVRVWDLGARKGTALRGGPLKGLRALAYTADSAHLLTADEAGLVSIWDARGGQRLAAYDWELGPLSSLAVAPDGMRAAVGGSGAILIWDLDL
jgi:WD40 repeat protein